MATLSDDHKPPRWLASLGAIYSLNIVGRRIFRGDGYKSVLVWEAYRDGVCHYRMLAGSRTMQPENRAHIVEAFAQIDRAHIKEKSRRE